MKRFHPGGRAAVGFGVVLVMLLCLGIFWREGVAHVNALAEKSICELQLREQLRRMQMAHYVWVDKLSTAVRTRTVFDGALDPSQCTFGKWYSSFTCESAEISRLCKELEVQHRMLHESGKAVNNALVRGDIGEAENLMSVTRQVFLPILIKSYEPLMRTLDANHQRLARETEDAVSRQRFIAAVIESAGGILSAGFVLFLVFGKGPIRAMFKEIAKGGGLETTAGGGPGPAGARRHRSRY